MTNHPNRSKTPESAIKALSKKHGGGNVEISYSAASGAFYVRVYMIPSNALSVAQGRYHEIADETGGVSLKDAADLREKIASTPVARGAGKTLAEAIEKTA